MKPRRGEVWLVDFGDPVGHEPGWRRPGVIVSTDYLNEGPAGIHLVVPCTSRQRGLRTHVELDPETSGIEEISYARGEDLKSLSSQRLIHRLGYADPQALAQLSEVLRYLLDL